jgi:hypothetical protein
MNRSSRPLKTTAKFTVRPPSNLIEAMPLSGLLDAVRQWWPALESWRGSHFLIEPKNISQGDQLLAVLQQWWPALESWHGLHFLIGPPASYNGADELKSLLQQWHGALESLRGTHFLIYPA